MPKVKRVWIGVAAALAALFLLVVILPCNRMGSKRGCVNQGEDCRKLATVVCFLQRHMSWNSEHEPHLVMVGRTAKAQAGFAWPPYVVFNIPRADGRWLMFRIGFRYDRNWRGYIFPTLAVKTVNQPLRY